MIDNICKNQEKIIQYDTWWWYDSLMFIFPQKSSVLAAPWSLTE